MASSSSSIAVLCVDREPGLAELTATYLERHDDAFTTSTATDVETAIGHLQDSVVDCIVSEYDLPGIDGLAFLQTVRADHPDLPFIIFTGQGSEAVASAAIGAGVSDYMQKAGGTAQYELLAHRVRAAAERTRARTREAEAEERARKILDGSPDAILLAADDEIVFANPSAVALFGLESDADLVGRPIDSLVAPDAADAFRSMFEALRDGAQPLVNRRPTIRVDGETLPIEVTARQVPWNGQSAVVLHMRDVSEQRRYEHELEATVLKLEGVLDSVDAPIWMRDTDSRFMLMNKHYRDLFDIPTSADVVGKSISDLLPADVVPRFRALDQEAIDTGQSAETEEVVATQFGERVYLTRITPLFDDNGEIYATGGVATDITEQIAREARLRQYEQAVEGTDDLIAAIDEEYRYLFANEAYQDFLGLDAEAVRGTSLPDGIGKQEFDRVKPYLGRAFDGQVVTFRMTRTRRDHVDRMLDFGLYPLSSDDESVTGVVAVIRDVTEQLERERHIDALDRLLRHNIANELTVIEGRAKMIIERAPDDVAALARPIMESTDRILTQADNQREIVNILAGSPTPQRLDLAELVAAVVDLAKTEYPDADVTSEGPDELELWTIPELERAITELVRNALRHVKRDETPTVTITVTEDTETITIEVADTGPGIPEDQRRIITEDAPVDALIHTSGMGLWLVKRIVTRANGTLRFEERDPHGSLVTISLPRNQ